MNETHDCYPLLLEPRLTPAIWGGHLLATEFGKAAPPDATIGESWECWDANTVQNGALAGSTVAGLRARMGARLLGDLDAASIFPILTKIIDAHGSLSVQVHPDDAYAQRVEHQRNGKTECWYVMRVQPGAELVMGWTQPMNRDEYERRVADGSLGDVLQRVPVKAGDAFYIPAGMLHSIGAGIVIFETQQASDLTYRIFDWNRLGADGKPRALHVSKAADVLDYSARPVPPVSTLAYAAEGFTRTALIADSHFLVERVTATETTAYLQTRSRPLILMSLDSPLRLSCADGEADLAAYRTALIPAAAQSVGVRADGPSAEFMLVTPPANSEGLRKRFADAGVAGTAIDRFLAQFAPR